MNVIFKCTYYVSHGIFNQQETETSKLMSTKLHHFTVMSTVDTRYLDIPGTLQKCRDIRMST